MIYLQTQQCGAPFSFEVCCAMYGCLENDLKYTMVSYEQVSSGELDHVILKNLFVGSVEFMQEVFKRVGKNDVRLPKNSNRHSEIMTLKEAIYQIKETGPKFIKPLHIKKFTGFVHEGGQYGCLDNIPDDEMVYVYSLFDSKIKSEWRLYIFKNQITDSCCYDGGFRYPPNYFQVEEIIKQNKDFPDTYTIDVAVLEDGQTTVVEFNDMWAIGNYGVPNWAYLEMLSRRYFQIIG